MALPMTDKTETVVVPLRVVVARAIANDLRRQDSGSGALAHPFQDEALDWTYVDQGSVDFGEIADAVLAALSASPLQPAADQSEALRIAVRALEFYADEKGREFPNDPNSGPWGVNSTDFGDMAIKALSRLSALGGE